jgi:predicted nucleotidyltransferase
MKFGLTEAEIKYVDETVVQVLKRYKARVFLFGSRANGKYKKFSDIDLLFSEDRQIPVPAAVISKILTDLEDSNFSYKVDLVRESELALSYRDSVNSEKIEL